MSALEPTSTPRVGSSTIRMRGVARQPFGEQHLLLVAARQIAHLALDVRRRDAQLARRSRSADLAHGRLGEEAPVRVGRQIGRDDVGGDGEVHEQADLLAILRQHRDAGRHRVLRAAAAAAPGRRRGCCRTGSAARRRWPRRPPCARRRAGRRGRRSRHSAARSVAETTGSRHEVAHLERDGGIRRGAARIGLERQLAADHQRDQLVDAWPALCRGRR